MNNLIQKWLMGRQQWIVAFNEICNCRPFLHSQNTLNIVPLLEEFCTQLIDYIALGHFKIYEKMSAERIPQELYNMLLETTHVALDFNEKYQSLPNLSTLDDDLGYLAEKLAFRLEGEDKLLAF